MGLFGALSTVHKDGGRARGLGPVSFSRENGVGVLLGSAPGYLGLKPLGEEDICLFFLWLVFFCVI
jgi:hypothetical protein